MPDFFHQPVMVDEVIELLNINPKGTYVDATLGSGGHAAAILQKLEPTGRLIGIDQDREALTAAKERLDHYPNFIPVHSNFADLSSQLSILNSLSIDGILFDLGVSSYQFDTAGRGFSLQKDGPLDMRMDQSRQGLTAEYIVNRAKEEELIRIFAELGDERYAKRIAQAIILKRPITKTLELAEIIDKVIPRKDPRQRLNSVVRVFQALRIAVNHELDSLAKGLAAAVPLLKKHGRIIVLSYHSGEDRIVKHFFKNYKPKLKILTKKPLTASAAEIKDNPRARSAKLRAAEKA